MQKRKNLILQDLWWSWKLPHSLLKPLWAINARLSIYLSIHLSIYPSIHPSIYLSIYLKKQQLSNEQTLQGAGKGLPLALSSIGPITTVSAQAAGCSNHLANRSAQPAHPGGEWQHSTPPVAHLTTHREALDSSRDAFGQLRWWLQSHGFRPWGMEIPYSMLLELARCAAAPEQCGIFGCATLGPSEAPPSHAGCLVASCFHAHFCKVPDGCLVGPSCCFFYLVRSKLIARLDLCSSHCRGWLVLPCFLVPVVPNERVWV